MSRDWTPREWDIVHKADPCLRDMIGKVVFIADDGTKTSLTSEKELMAYKMFPHLKLVGLDIIAMCAKNGILDTEDGLAIVGRIEDILNGKEDDSDFAEKVRSWYDGELQPGYYMTENNHALFDLILMVMEV